jgi:hypothetical protein
MSPLPERLADRSAFIKNDELIDSFLNETIGSDKIWRLYAYDEDPGKLNELIKSMGIDFDLPVQIIDCYCTETERGTVVHKVYTTTKKGVYLEKQSSINGRNKRTVFVRLGEDANNDYLASLKNG